jgi:maltooligosyltrehalose trehalohydrolase
MSAIHFLEELAAETRKLETELDRKLLLIAESDLNDPKLVQSTEKGGYALDAQWSDDFHHALHALLTGETTGYYGDFGSLAALAKAIQQAYVFDGCYSAFRHRRHGRRPVGLSGDNFLAYLQNHDQVGNRAQGDRSSDLMDVARLKIGAALVLTTPFVPLLFQGEEWAASSPFLYFTDHRDAGLGRAVREGRRREFAAFGWKPEDVPDPQAPETFQRSKLKWSELSEAPHSEILEWYRALIRLRRENPALTRVPMNETRVHFDEDARWLSVQRGPVWILCNFAETENRIACPGGRILLSSREMVQDRGQINLPAVSVALVLSE